MKEWRTYPIPLGYSKQLPNICTIQDHEISRGCHPTTIAAGVKSKKGGKLLGVKPWRRGDQFDYDIVVGYGAFIIIRDI